MIPKELPLAIEYLQIHPAKLPAGSGDSRRDSGEAEKTIILSRFGAGAKRKTGGLAACLF